MSETKAARGRQLPLVCNCQRSMVIDGAKLAKALGAAEPLPVHTELCRSQISAYEAALAHGGRVHVACTQEAPLFRELAEEKSADADLRFTNIRETAGWSEARANALPKMAALLAAATLEPEPAATVTLNSSGVCLVYGRGQAALDAATALSDRLSVSVLLTDAEDALPPASGAFAISAGRVRTARGALGGFEVVVDGYAPMLPSSRSSIELAMPRDGATSRCDLILDLSGRAPLFTAHDRRDGYLYVDPQNPVAVARALFEISDLVGEFEKPRYVAYDAAICAHSRSGKTGCSNCLENCPVGAISPNGDHVLIDASVCGGCGNCAAVCPTGAISSHMPRRRDLVQRLSVLLEASRKAGGVQPVVMFHDEKHGSGMIGAMARFGRGLPANVLPVPLYSTLQLGHEMLAAALALGAERVVVLAPPEHPEELQAIEAQAGIGNALLEGLGHGSRRIEILTERDPDAIEAALHDAPALPPLAPGALPAQGTKRDIARTVLARLHETAPAPVDLVALPKGAPYGRIVVDTSGCTLCLSCVGACPANALGDSPDRPELTFIEAACVQCGICVATCPEKVISLEPRYNFSTAALRPEVMKSEEPFHCIRCGAAFGAKSTIERVVTRLRGHSMYKDAGQLDLIQMCDTCRIEAVANSASDPFRVGDRPRVRTTDDYLAAETAAKASGKKPEDFLN